MKASKNTTENWTELSQKAAQMLCCLDKDIQHIEEMLLHLDEIRTLVLKRKENALKELLEKVQTKYDEYKNNESQRHLIRKELADVLNCGVQQVRLSRLERTLPEKLRDRVIQKRIKLMSLTDKLKKEHLNTVLLLAECARFNRMFLNSIFDLGKTHAVTYSASGTTHRQAGRSFVNLEM
jgi:hypothetical protein